MIRSMRETDLQPCGAIYAKAFPAEYWGTDWNDENATEYLSDYFEQKRFVGYVHEEDNEITGCIFAVRRIAGSREEIYINEMAVLPEKQGRGIGRQLLNAILEYCRENDLAGAVLYTNEHAPAFRFYEKNGFKVSQGTICLYYDE